MSLIASIDCGTTSTRFIVFSETADVLAVEQQEFKQSAPAVRCVHADRRQSMRSQDGTLRIPRPWSARA